MFNLKEIKYLIISIIILGLVFGFNDGKETFVLTNWLLNLLGMTLLVAVALLFREVAIKLMAKRHRVDSEYQLWNIHKLWFKGWNLKFPIPLGIIFAILISLLSKGKIFFTAIGSHKLTEKLAARTGKKYIFLEYKEESLIVMTGLLANIFLIYLSGLIMTVWNINLNDFITINFFIGLFNIILPVSTLDGAKIFFGSRLQWLFGVLFLITSFALFRFDIIFGLILSAIISGIGVLIYYIKWH